MEPFNLEKAKKGSPVCLQDGRFVKILDFDFNGDLLVKVNNTVIKDNRESCYLVRYSKYGEAAMECLDNDRKLFMLPIIGYMNIYKNADGHIEGGKITRSLEECSNEIHSYYDHVYFGQAKVEFLDIIEKGGEK